MSASLDRTVRLWRLGDQPVVEEAEAALRYDDLHFEQLHVLRDGRVLVFRDRGVEVWRGLRELVLHIPAALHSNARWQVSGDERWLAISSDPQGAEVWSLEDGVCRSAAVAAIPWPQPLFTEAIVEALRPAAGAALWAGPGGPYAAIGDGPRGWATPLPRSADHRRIAVPDWEQVGIIALDGPPQLVQRVPFTGRLRAGCITAERIVLCNDAGALFQYARAEEV